ncbi:MAG: SDR family NAD(P)-dependent oxidoreductase [bacterium]|nr:SDR family NAD(P)-dependent oxidoreductase [bacterium]
MKKTAVITGGSSGLGLAFAEQLSERGYRTILIARDRQRLAATVQAEYEQIEFLIVNAGVVHVKLLSEMSYDELRQDLDIDLWGAAVTAKTFLPLLKSGAKILFISSGFGLMGLAGYSAYCAAKAGVIHFAEALRRELHSQRIAVYVACPSDIDTPQFHEEQAAMPSWMKGGSAPRVSAMPASAAARKILRRCQGKRFMITISPDVWALSLASKVLSRRMRDWLLDRMFPRPRS